MPGMEPFGAMNFVFSLFPVLFIIVFVVILFSFVMNGARYWKNYSSPKQSHYARIVAKRTEVRHHTHHHGGGGNPAHITGSSRTYYYITLEFDNGERKEFLDVKRLYGLVAEGDTGYAMTQGDWIVAFERDVNMNP